MEVEEIEANIETDSIVFGVYERWWRTVPVALRMYGDWIFVTVVAHDEVFKLLCYTHELSPLANKRISIRTHDMINQQAPHFTINSQPNILRLTALNLEESLTDFAERGRYLSLDWNQLSETQNEDTEPGDAFEYNVTVHQ